MFAEKGDRSAIEASSPDEVAREMERLLSGIREALRKPVSSAFSSGGLTGPQRMVMQALVRAPESLSLKQLQAEVGLAQSTVSEIVRRLTSKGLISRRVNKNDGRAVLLSPSPQVRRFLTGSVPELAAAPLVQALRDVPAETRTRMLGALIELADLLGRKG